jgi:putative transcriptional regulator
MFTFIETSLFTRLVSECLSDEDYSRLQRLPRYLGTYSGRSARKLKMTNKRDIGAEILDGVRQLKRGEAGRVVNVPSVRSIRKKTGLSQSRFASLLGVSVRTLQDWEQGRRAPSGAARTLLLIAHKNPSALSDVA